MERDISFGFLLKTLKKSWLYMLIAAVAVGVCAAVFANFLPKTYSSTVSFYVRNQDMNSDIVSQNYLNATEQLINDYVDLIESESILSLVCEEVKETTGKEITPARIRGMLSASASKSSSMFNIKVSDRDPELAYNVACAIEKVAPSAVTEIAKNGIHIEETLAPNIAEIMRRLSKSEEYSQYVTFNEPNGFVAMLEQFLRDETKLTSFAQLCFVSVNSPVLDKSHDSPNIPRIAIAGSAAAAVIVFLIVFIKGLFEFQVASEDDIKRLINRPVIGAIPHWETTSKK